MSEETPNFNIGPEGEMTAPAAFTYKDHALVTLFQDSEIVRQWYRHLDR
jgi:hypothetical protein